MPTEHFSVTHDAGKTVFFRFLDVAQGKLYDFSTDTWEVSPADENMEAAERVAFGDATQSVYWASYDLDTVWAASVQDTTQEIIVQAVDDLATDEIIEAQAFRLYKGYILEDYMAALADGDRIIDISGSPYELVVKTQGTAIELLRKKLRDVNSVAIADTDTVLGREEES